MAGKKKNKTKKKLCGFFGRVVMSPVGESGSSLFFFFHPSFFNHSHPHSTLSDNRKKLYSYSLFHPDSIYSSNNNSSYSENRFQVYFSDLKEKTAIQHNIQKGKETKRKLVTKPAKNLQLLLLIYQQLTYSEYRFKQSRH